MQDKEPETEELLNAEKDYLPVLMAENEVLSSQQEKLDYGAKEDPQKDIIKFGIFGLIALCVIACVYFIVESLISLAVTFIFLGFILGAGYWYFEK